MNKLFKRQLADLDPLDRRLAGLSAFVRRAKRQGDKPPLVTHENWERFAAAHSHTSVPAKLRLVLEHLAERSMFPGDIVVLDARDYPLFDAAGPPEVGYLVQTLADRQDIGQQVTDLRIVLTAQGWERLEPSGLGGEPRTCFVAMSFKPEMDPAYENGIRPAVDDCGISVIRIDRIEHSENINDKMLAEIMRAQFAVADFTHHPAGVYFEAGFAFGLGRLVIWTCRRSDFAEKVHFDTRPFNYILWDDENELRTRLTNRIRALVPGAKLA
jgi:hypothetical protein